MSGRPRPLCVAVIGAESAMGTAIAHRLAAGQDALPAGDPRLTETSSANGSPADPSPPDRSPAELPAAQALGDDLSEILCIGPRRVAIAGTTWRIVELSDPALARKLAGVDVLVLAHLDPNITAPSSAPSSGPPSGTGTDITGTTTEVLLAAAESASVRRVVLVSSSMVLGALPDNPVPLPDDAPSRARMTQGFVAEAMHAEAAVAAWAQRTGGAPTLVRHALLVGPGIDTALTRFFEAPRLLVIGDAQQLWQFTHVDDLASAVDFVIRRGVEGPVSAVCSGWWGQDQILERTGMRPFRLPEQVAMTAADRLYRVGVSPSPSAELDYLRYPWVVSGDRLRDAGWVPEYSTDQVVGHLADQVEGSTAIAGRRLGRPDAASLGAAGAAAAVLGAAAILRARRRQGGM